MTKLTDRKVRAVQEPGMHGDGNGLYLRVGPTGAKSWILRTAVHGRRRELGLGSVSLVSLKEARDKAHELRKVARAGGDPDTARNKKILTFDEAATIVHKNLLPTWRNKKHAETWISTITNYASPTLGSRPLETITAADVLAVLSPIWTEKHETAKRLKQRISSIFDWAKGAGHYPHENPVNGLKKALPVVKRRQEHLAAMDWRELPAFMSELAQRNSVSARTLEFIILTAARSGEARGACWSEIEDNVWIVPAERMKRGLEHRVPLSVEALDVLGKVRGLDEDLVFPSISRSKSGHPRPQSVMVFKSLLSRMKRDDFTVHGFRSTFRDWCSESAHIDREVAEASLSHAVGSEVERSYARSDLLERRAILMDAWARYTTGASGSVVEMVRA